MSELLQALAFVFRRKGADRMASLDLKHSLSLDLRWFAPADAKRLVDHAVDVGLLELTEDEQVVARFDPAAVEVPVTFKPTLQAIEEPAPDHVPPPRAAAPADGQGEGPEGSGGAEAAAFEGPAVLLEAAEASGEPLERLVREAEEERARRGRLLTPQVAAILVARRRGVDVKPHLAAARAALRPE